MAKNLFRPKAEAYNWNCFSIILVLFPIYFAQKKQISGYGAVYGFFYQKEESRQPPFVLLLFYPFFYISNQIINHLIINEDVADVVLFLPQSYEL